MPERTRFLKAAAHANNIEVEFHDIEVAKPLCAPLLRSNDLLYKDAKGERAGVLFRTMISDQCTTFLKDWRSSFNYRGASYPLHAKMGFPVIPSVTFLPRTEEELDEVIQLLGSFPVVVKVRGHSKGVGVIRVDSRESLISLVDFLKTLNPRVLVRKYIPHEYYVRAVVVGDRVAASHATYVGEQEFRSNTSIDPAKDTRRREPYQLSEELSEKVVAAVQVLGFETGGVDLLVDHKSNSYIAEVNFPNDFSYTQKVTGVNIAQLMIEHLLHKQAERS